MGRPVPKAVGKVLSFLRAMDTFPSRLYREDSVRSRHWRLMRMELGLCCFGSTIGMLISCTLHTLAAKYGLDFYVENHWEVGVLQRR